MSYISAAQISAMQDAARERAEAEAAAKTAAEAVSDTTAETATDTGADTADSAAPDGRAALVDVLRRRGEGGSPLHHPSDGPPPRDGEEVG